MKKEILKLRKQGFSYNQIASKLNCSKGTIAYHCGEGQKEKTLRRQAAKQGERVAKLRATRKQLKAFVNRYKAMKGCVDCGIKNPIVLECDHRDRDEKKFNISQISKWGYSMEMLKEELRKCDIRCANCHRIKSHENKDYEIQ